MFTGIRMAHHDYKGPLDEERGRKLYWYRWATITFNGNTCQRSLLDRLALSTFDSFLLLILLEETKRHE